MTKLPVISTLLMFSTIASATVISGPGYDASAEIYSGFYPHDHYLSASASIYNATNLESVTSQVHAMTSENCSLGYCVGRISASASANVAYGVEFEPLTGEAMTYDGYIPVIFDWAIFVEATVNSLNGEAIPLNSLNWNGSSGAGASVLIDSNVDGVVFGQSVFSRDLEDSGLLEMSGSEELLFSSESSIAVYLSSGASITRYQTDLNTNIFLLAYADPVITIDPSWYLSDQFSLNIYSDILPNIEIQEVGGDLIPPSNGVSVSEPRGSLYILSMIILFLKLRKFIRCNRSKWLTA